MNDKLATAKFALLSLALSLAACVELWAGSGILRPLLAGALPLPMTLLSGLLVIVGAGAIINTTTAMMRPSTARIAAAGALVAQGLIIALALTRVTGKTPLGFYFAGHLGGETLLTFCLIQFTVSQLKVAGAWINRLPYAAAAIVAAFGVAGFVGQSWISLSNVIGNFGMVRDSVVVLAPMAALAILSLFKSMRLDPKSAIGSLRLRLPLPQVGRRDHSEELAWRGLVVTVGTLLAGLMINWAIQAMGTGATLVLTTWTAGCVGLLYLGISELDWFNAEQKHGDVTAKIAPASAKRFLRRHTLNDQASWAATVGLRTAHFSVDHDPGGALHQELPASIMQIRGEEIQRCVGEVLGALQLHSYVAGHRIFGAIDSEAAVRPCIDTLKMFACLYLDAGPLVERRIKGLTALLPIVDPGLARVLKPKDIASLIRRNLWFFHFDFGWLDQHVIHSPRATRYEVRMATLSSRIRGAMMGHLERTGGIGNFVWLGPEARDRLLQEAPAMRPIVETCPVVIEAPTAGAPMGADEQLMFIIKFEQLIPRLQRYFDLDSMRKALLDFEPSTTSAQLLNLLGLQITKSETPEEVSAVLKQVTSVPWRGFREKDGALQLILAAFHQLGDMLTPGASLAEADAPKARALHAELLDAVRAIGYPSQVLHNAQINKLALRDVPTLKHVANDSDHPRFAEAWLLLATADYQKFNAAQRHELLSFLAGIGNHPSLASLRLVQMKTVDALASLGSVLDGAETVLLKRAFGDVYDWFASFRVDPDICCLLLDAQLFLGAQRRSAALPEDKTLNIFDAYLTSLIEELGPNHPKMIGVMSRWQDVRSWAADAAA